MKTYIVHGFTFETNEYISQKFNKYKVNPSTIAEIEGDRAGNQDGEGGIEKEQYLFEGIFFRL